MTVLSLPVFGGIFGGNRDNHEAFFESVDLTPRRKAFANPLSRRLFTMAATTAPPPTSTTRLQPQTLCQIGLHYPQTTHPQQQSHSQTCQDHTQSPHKKTNTPQFGKTFSSWWLTIIGHLQNNQYQKETTAGNDQLSSSRIIAG